MTLDEWIEELRYGDLDSIKARLDAIELLEFLEELKRFRERGSNGRKALVQSVCDSLREELYDDDSEDDYDAGFDNGIKRAMRLIKAEVRGEDGRE
jgi:hypothetical protein